MLQIGQVIKTNKGFGTITKITPKTVTHTIKVFDGDLYFNSESSCWNISNKKAAKFNGVTGSSHGFEDNIGRIRIPYIGNEDAFRDHIFTRGSKGEVIHEVHTGTTHQKNIEDLADAAYTNDWDIGR